MLVAALAVVGLTVGSGPESESLGRSGSVVIVSVPGLQWQDLEGSETPHLDALLRGGSALLSVRASEVLTTRFDGYLTVNAGNRVGVGADQPDTGPEDPRCAPVVDAARDAADDALTGAEPGALGSALHDAGLTTAAYGSDLAALTLMDDTGCVDVAGPEPPVTLTEDVTVVELLGLERDAPAAIRLAALVDIDASVARLDLGDDALVLLVAVSAPDDAADVTVAGVAGAASGDGHGDAPWALLSATTRRGGYVTLADVAPTILEALGLDVPASMNGTPITRAVAAAADDDDQIGDLADAADLTRFRDRAVGPVSVMFTVLIVFCGFAALRRLARPARMLAPLVIAIPSVAFLSGLVDYHRLPLDFYVVAVLAVSIAVAAIATASYSTWGPWAPVAALATLLWLVLLTDVVTGGRLQINTPLGYSATSAGRFQGFGNLAFALLAGASLVVAVVPLLLGRDRGPSAVWAAMVGCVTIIGVGAPGFGSDVGGTLALVPTFVVVVLLVAGRRVGWRRVAAAALASVLVLCVLAAIDRARPASSRTHLGRFADRLLDGEASLIIRRKIQGNVDILFATFWSFVLVGLFVGAGVVWWWSRERFGAFLAERPPVRAALIGFVIVAFLGSALNDSGVVIFGIMLGVFIPFLVSVLIVRVPRAARR
jgi:hypothetical protein